MRAAATKMFSCTDGPVNTFGTCVLMPTPSRAISCGRAPVMSVARNMIWARVWAGGTGDHDLARRGPELAREHLEDRAFAGPVRAEQAAHLPLGQGEIDRVD